MDYWIASIVQTGIIVFCLANIHYRLARIEERLGLPPYNAFNLVPDAQAREKPLSNHAQIKGENNVR